MQVNKPTAPLQPAPTKPTQGVQGTKPSAPTQTTPPSPSTTENVQFPDQDRSNIQKLPGKEKLPDMGHFFSDHNLIDDTLDSALLTKMPGARQAAMRTLMNDLKGMTPGELDDIKDSIVKRMASPDTSQTERDVLKNMYDVVDAVAENRPVPEKLIGEPRIGNITFPPRTPSLPHGPLMPTIPPISSGGGGNGKAPLQTEMPEWQPTN